MGLHDFRNLCRIDLSNGVTNFKRRVLSCSIVPIGEQSAAPSEAFRSFWWTCKYYMAKLLTPLPLPVAPHLSPKKQMLPMIANRFSRLRCAERLFCGTRYVDVLVESLSFRYWRKGLKQILWKIVWQRRSGTRDVDRADSLLSSFWTISFFFVYSQRECNAGAMHG